MVGPLQLEPLKVATPQPEPDAQVTPGIGTADRAALANAPTNPDSLEGLLGRDFGGRPWTRAVWWLGFSAVPVVAASALALVRHRQLRAVAAAAVLAEAERSAGTKRKRKPAQAKKARVKKAQAKKR
jgi:hypothetical protein